MESRLEKIPFKSALPIIKRYSGIDMNENDYIETAFTAWDKIGNRIGPVKRFVGTIENYMLELPCLIEDLEAVTLLISCCGENLPVEEPLTNLNTDSKYYPRGEFIDYEWADKKTLKFAVDNKDVEVIYKLLDRDHEDLPYITTKEADAIARYCIFVEMEKMMYQGIGNIQIVQLAEQRWLKEAHQARVPKYLTQNFHDKYLEINRSLARKHYGRSFKALR